jgi:hypothetical protein
MTTIKQVFLGAAVAGVVAGTGSAIGTAVAYAEPTENGSSSTSASESSARSADQPRSRNRGSAAKPGPAAAASRGDNAPAPAESDTPRKKDGPRVSVRTPSVDRIPSAPEAPAVDPGAPEPSTPAPGPDAVAAAPAATTPATAPEVVVRRTVAAAPALTPAPAAPAPTPLRLPLIPDLPAVPVAPASASVSTIAGTNTRVRAASALAQAEVLGDPPATHVLLIGTDGTNMSKILEYTYDNPLSGFRVAMDEGITGTTTLVGHTTISGPSWSTILTGVWDNKSGVINNLFDPAPYKKWPTVINLLEYGLGDNVTTAVIANWQYINDIADAGGYPADVNTYIPYDAEDGWEAADDEVADATIALINATGGDESTFVFSYQVGVDEEGHLHGGNSTQYRDAVINTSENIKAILDAVDAWETANPGEKWTIIITTDHGHQPSVGFGHGFQSPNETSSFIIFDPESDNSNDGNQNLGYQNVDITPTIVDLFGLPLRSDFDGVPLGTKDSGIVVPEDLKASLTDALAMYGYPDIATDFALGARTVFASIPYFIDGFFTDFSDQLQGIVDQDIFLISALAGAAQWVVGITGDALVFVTQALARVVATLTGSGTIAPTDQPLPPPPANSELLLLLEGGAVLT